MTIKFVPGHNGVLIDIQTELDINEALLAVRGMMVEVDPLNSAIECLEEAIEKNSEEYCLE